MHFGGYEVGKTHTQRLVITNTSRVSRRIHVVLPSTPFFRAECSRRGLVAPGMSERVDVQFCPTEHRYYYDCVRVHAEDGNLLVPLHAYPVMNETVFPSAVDFGLCAVGAEHVERVPLRCKVPIAFEFHATLNATSGPFTVDPKRGVVPANGEVIVTIRFAPTTLRTAVAELVVETSQFGSAPKTCRVRGTGFPSVARDRAIAAMYASDGGDVRDVGRLADGTVGGGAPPGSAPFRSRRGAKGRDPDGDAPFGDTCTEVVTSAGRRYARAVYAATFALEDGARDTGTDTDEKEGGARAKPPSRAPPPGSGPGPRGRRVRVTATKTETDDSGARARSTRTPSESSDSEDCVDGVHVPRRLRGAADVAYVLGQRRGKRRAKDLRRAVAAKDATRVASESTIRSVGVAADVINAVGREIRRKRLAKVLRGETLGAEERGGGAFEAIREAVRCGGEGGGGCGLGSVVAKRKSRHGRRRRPDARTGGARARVRTRVRTRGEVREDQGVDELRGGGRGTHGEGERAAVARRRAARDDVVNVRRGGERRRGASPEGETTRRGRRVRRRRKSENGGVTRGVTHDRR